MSPIHLVDPLTWYLHASGSEQAEAWVAFGTLALALVTTWAIRTSARHSRDEHNRFEQGYAPLLEILPFGSQGSLFYLVQVANFGYGPALDVQLLIHGRRTKKYYNEIVEPAQGDRPPIFRSEVLPFRIEASESTVIPGPLSWQFDIRQLNDEQDDAIEIDGLDPDEARLNYTDRFGNPYSTVYSDFNNRKYAWVRPRKFLRTKP